MCRRGQIIYRIEYLHGHVCELLSLAVATMAYSGVHRFVLLGVTLSCEKTTIDSSSCMFLGAGPVNANQIALNKEKPDLHLLFYVAETSDTSILIGSLSLLEGLKFLFYTGFWQILA